ncbi:PulJ/GspJ family protein [Stieleria varia]|uniref:Pseudopilin GspJ n=1 Tax=Stieleria varia TaxID=2528005 RepID=A0A5C6B8U6_9BACT|nr:prepilin-type N-terminal cleavage/methylation domain-containing protein [Stieleria varia]TWU07686.1 hypothetical protein Pla52n_02590 [Stieleria varia]
MNSDQSRQTIVRTAHNRRAFTLLELILTLAMSVVLMSLINAAFQFYVSDMDVADTDIRQTMLAAAVMQMIEDDLRSTLHPEPTDTSALEALLASSAASMGGQITGQSTGEDLSAAGIESEEELPEETATEAATLDSGTAILQTPGLIGNQYQIQMDISKLPRLEEYIVMLDENVTDLQDIPSDLKTVSYFVQSAGFLGGVTDPLDELAGDGTAISNTDSGGLVRRSLDRNATVYAASSGNLPQLTATGELLAPEVAAIEFSYWDGTTWLYQWNSDELGELPLAIRVQLSMIKPGVDRDSVSVTDTDTVRVFQHIVRLPMAKVIEIEEEETATTDAAGTET